MDEFTMWQEIIYQGSALILGAAGGGLVSAFVGWKMLRSQTAQELIRDALVIQAEKEAWILEGLDYEKKRLSECQGLPTEPSGQGSWLFQVEVRTVLDEASWNSPDGHYYGIIAGRRAWIVRDTITNTKPHAHCGGCYPALLSSRALEDICGWVERVSISRNGRLLSKRDLEALSPLLGALCTSDCLDVLGSRLSGRAQLFLHKYAKAVRKSC
jgi:hypothetical protein